MKLLKSALTSAWGDSALSTVVAALERLGPGGDLLRVLTYHRIDVPDDSSPYYPGLISATPDEFATQLDWLAAENTVVSLDEVLAALEGRCSLKPGAVLLTFDDANRCLAGHAWPALKQRKLPAVAFVPTAFPDSPRRFWWDRLHATLARTKASHWQDGEMRYELQTADRRRAAYKSLARRAKSLADGQAADLVDRVCHDLGEVDFENNVLSWSELQRLSAEGLALAPHTRTHPLLSRVPLEQAREEAVGSYEDLRSRLGDAPRVMAYPAGDHDDAVVGMLRDEGFAAGFTVRRGINRIGGCDRLRLLRINVGRGTTLGLFRAQLLRQARIFSH